MEKKLLSLALMSFLGLCLSVFTRADIIERPLDISPASVTKEVRTESKFFQNLTFKNKTSQKLKFWISTELFYIDENGEKYEVELRKKTSWSFSPVVGIGIGNRGRTRSGVGVEVSPNGRGNKYVVETASGINFKADESKVLTVDFDFSDLRVKNNKGMRIGEGKISGKLILNDRGKFYSDIVIPIEITIGN